MTDWSFWLQAIVRWIHVFSAILWIGQTYLFNFFEKNFEPSGKNAAGEDSPVAGNLWMVHGGGYYYLEKHRFGRETPPTLHWFKWEAASTWLSGALLIALIYYHGGLLVEPEMDFSTAAIAGIGAPIAGWVLYDLLANSPLARRGLLFGMLGLIVLTGLHVLFENLMSGRAAFIHVGAVMGTIMAANVWMRIIPAQRRMLDSASAGKTVDPALAATGPLRSKHNSYLVIPLIFIMIANHYPTISYGSSDSTLILAGLLVVGWTIARWLRG